MNASEKLKNDGGNGTDRLRGTVLRQLTALSKMKVPELREKWRELNGTKPPAYNRQYLIRRLAYRIQEMYYGGLSENAKQQLAQVAEADPLASVGKPKAQKKQEPTRLVPGTRLKRRWRGVEYEVVVVEGGFKYDGQVYRSLTAVAIAITGTKWSGRIFFGLPPVRSIKKGKRHA